MALGGRADKTADKTATGVVKLSTHAGVVNDEKALIMNRNAI